MSARAPRRTHTRRCSCAERVPSHAGPTTAAHLDFADGVQPAFARKCTPVALLDHGKPDACVPGRGGWVCSGKSRRSSARVVPVQQRSSQAVQSLRHSVGNRPAGGTLRPPAPNYSCCPVTPDANRGSPLTFAGHVTEAACLVPVLKLLQSPPDLLSVLALKARIHHVVAVTDLERLREGGRIARGVTWQSAGREVVPAVEAVLRRRATCSAQAKCVFGRPSHHALARMH